MSTYADFLATKRSRAGDFGVRVDPDDLHPTLFDFQRHITTWSLAKGRAAIFADCGLGKTLMQCEWARRTADTSLILAPLSVARQSVKDARKIELDVRYVRSQEQVTGPGVWITNYEMAHHFDPSAFGAVVLDEASILKNCTGATRNQLIRQWRDTQYRLTCTATPAPNDVTELTNQAEFLGVMNRGEMLAAYFVHDDDGWRMKGHAIGPMFDWMATWATALRRPSDLGFPDTGYELPPLRIHAEVVGVNESPEGQLFATELGGIGGRHKVRRQTLAARGERAARLASDDHQWIVWCGLNDEASQITDQLGSEAVNVEGSWTPEAKAEALEAFQDGEIRVLVTKPSIAGFGMNFQQCHRMAFVGLSDSYEAYYQAIRRCWRFGQTQPVDVHVVVSELEQQIVQNVRRKEGEASAVTARLVERMRTREQVPV